MSQIKDSFEDDTITRGNENSVLPMITEEEEVDSFDLPLSGPGPGPGPDPNDAIMVTVDKLPPAPERDPQTTASETLNDSFDDIFEEKEDEQRENSGISKVENPAPPFGGFMTAGKGVLQTVSESALEKARKMMRETTNEEREKSIPTIEPPPPITPFCGFTTAGKGTTVAVSEKALEKARKILGEEEEEGDSALEGMPPLTAEKERAPQPTSPFPAFGGFTTAGKGTTVAVSKKALEKARKILGEEDKESDVALKDTPPLTVDETSAPQPPTSSPAFGGFMTAGKNVKVTVNEETLMKVRKMMEGEVKEEVPPPPSHMGSGDCPVGFMTAGTGQKVTASEKALNVARRLLAEKEEGMTNGESIPAPFSSPLNSAKRKAVPGIISAPSPFRSSVPCSSTSLTPLSTTPLPIKRRRMGTGFKSPMLKNAPSPMPSPLRQPLLATVSSSGPVENEAPKSTVNATVPSVPAPNLNDSFDDSCEMVPVVREDTVALPSSLIASSSTVINPTSAPAAKNNSLPTHSTTNSSTVPLRSGSNTVSTTPQALGTMTPSSRKCSPYQENTRPSPNGGSTELNYRAYRLIGEVKDTDKNAVVKVSILQISKNKPFYKGCVRCKKTMGQDEEGDEWCTHCHSEHWRWFYKLNVLLGDFSGTHWCMFFDEMAARLLGETADELQKMEKYHPDRFHQFLLSFHLIVPKMIRVVITKSSSTMYPAQWKAADLREPDHDQLTESLERKKKQLEIQMNAVKKANEKKRMQTTTMK